MRHHTVKLAGKEFRVEGFADAVKLISISGLTAYRSRELSNLASCRLDLIFTKACLDYLRAAKEPSPLLQEALWRVAIFHYGKCFAQSGSRRPLPYTKILPSKADSDDAQPREIHKHFLALRNKHLAHDENAWLQVLTGAVIAAAGKGYNIEEVVCMSFQGNTFGEGSFGNLYLLVEHALTWVEVRFETLCDEITKELEKVPRETLLRQPTLEYRAPGAEDVASTRSHS